MSKRTEHIVMIYVLLFVSFSLVLSTSFMSVMATTVTVVKSADDVLVGDTFTVFVQCSPTEPVKAWESQFRFNAEKLQVVSVTEGTIFSGFQEYFYPGVIDNVGGNITKLFNLIIGKEATQNPGSLVILTFLAKTVGFSKLEVVGFGITNEIDYLPVTVINTSVFIRLPYDVNSDGIINIFDLVLVSSHLEEVGVPGWIPEDVNRDGRIKIIDLLYVASYM